VPALPIRSPMPQDSPPDWPGAVWVGEVDLGDPLPDRVALAGADGYRRARLLVRAGRQPRGFVELPVTDGAVDLAALRAAAADLYRPDPSDPVALPPVSVVLCTRDRPGPLRAALASLLAVEYPDVEIVVVDNASRTGASAEVVRDLADPRVRLVTEPRPGLARARNRGMTAAAHDLVAFTDDDVVVDRWWLHGLVEGFERAGDVALVCGLVPSAEVRSFPQAYFDARVTWARSCQPRVYALDDPPADQPLFPFQVGAFGTGANFAVRRGAVLALGGFDEALGVGSHTRGGEDIDMFVRVLLAGHRLAYQPSAMVWHRHRADVSALRDQISGYGLGLGAWITKLLLRPRTAAMVAARAAGGVRHAGRMTRVEVAGGVSADDRGDGAGLRGTELWALARGPFAYARARLSGARATPLRGSVPVVLDPSRGVAGTRQGAE
jgi:GT2 family glycosyltransferase